MSKTKIVVILTLLLGIGLLIFTASHIKNVKSIYREGDMCYENIRSQIRNEDVNDMNMITQNATIPQDTTGRGLSPELNNGNDTETDRIDTVYIPEIDINFEVLEEISDNSVAWLYSPGSPIDYPVMKTTDNNYYLNHLPDGTINVNGALFIDRNNAPDFSDQITVIYGHNMRSEKMFGSLKWYRNQEYYDEFPYMYLYTSQSNYRIDLLFGCVVSSGFLKNIITNNNQVVDMLIEHANNNTTFKASAQYSDNDRLVIMSTCAYDYDNARYIIIGVLRDQY